MKELLGIINAEDCFLHSASGKPAEGKLLSGEPLAGVNDSGIEDEIFSGWAVRIFPDTEQNGWVKIETHYGYMGYVHKAQITVISREELQRRQDKGRFFRIRTRAADLLDQPKVQGLPLEHLLKNAIVELLDTPACVCDLQNKMESQVTGWCLVRTAAGHVGYVHECYLEKRLDDDEYLLCSQSADSQDFYFREHFLNNPPEEMTFREGLINSARSYLGVQYRWGGKSSLGLDCSGLAFMSYLENGVLIYRDAKIKSGYPVSEIPREQLKPGDLIFFPGHVAMFLGEGRYIHSTGCRETPYVTINSLNPADEDYREDLAGKITACGSVFPTGQINQGQKEQSRFSDLKLQQKMKEAKNTKTDEILARLRRRLDAMPGSVSIVYKELSTEKTFAYREKEPHPAASVIKLFLMAAVYQGFADGDYAPDDTITVRREDCVPSCGVLTYLQGERSVSVRDLVELMIIVSDNTAANLLFDLVGEERLEKFLHEDLGLEKTAFRRKMFDAERAAQGIENYVTAADAAELLEMIYREKLISQKASREMYQILTHQRLNGKIPFYLHTLPQAPVIAHKTGEDNGITHDVAVIEGKSPFVLCFLGSGLEVRDWQSDVPKYERLMAETAMELYTGA
ncbi:MAG: serine hydrolase [Lachnospiraceae bacterium]|nr:serine hydrolase [Lachnospiraceae bacterium]